MQLPPLRDRREDIPLLVDYFLNRCALRGRGRKAAARADALTSLVDYSWPGNVRELEHLVQRLIIFSGGYTIQRQDLPWAQASQSAGADDDAAYRQLVRTYLDSSGGERTYSDLIEKIERLLIVEALRRCDGNQTHAAQLLRIPRPTLHAKMQKLGIIDL